MTYKTIWKPKEHTPWKVDPDLILQKVQEKLDKGDVFGVIGFHNSKDIPLDKVATRYISAKRVTEGISLDYEIMQSPEGIPFKAFVEGGGEAEHNVSIIGRLGEGATVLNVDEFLYFNITFPDKDTDVIELGKMERR